jgi:hypothetical protein
MLCQQLGELAAFVFIPLAVDGKHIGRVKQLGQKRCLLEVLMVYKRPTDHKGDINVISDRMQVLKVLQIGGQVIPVVIDGEPVYLDQIRHFGDACVVGVDGVYLHGTSLCVCAWTDHIVMLRVVAGLPPEEVCDCGDLVLPSEDHGIEMVWMGVRHEHVDVKVPQLIRVDVAPLEILCFA